MYVVTQNRLEVVNMNKVSSFFVDHLDGKILWACFDSDPICQDGCMDLLGEYENEERTKEVMNELLDFMCEREILDVESFKFNYQYTSTRKKLVEDYKRANVFYMPEK